MVRKPTVDKNGIRRGAWSEEEDNILKSFVLKNGHPNWRQLPRFTGLARCGKSCRLRWKNYLKPDLKRGNYTQEEVEQIVKLREEHGNRWSQIASKLPGRTDNEIKNYWHTHLKKNATHSSQSIATSIHKNSENSDQTVATDSVNVIESTTVDSFPENLDSMESIQVDFGEILQEAFSFSTSNDLNTSQSIQMKEFDSVRANSFPEVLSSMKYNSMESFQEDFGGIWNEPFLFNTSNNQITQSIGCDSARTFWTELLLLGNSYSQNCSSLLALFNSALCDESVTSEDQEIFSTMPLMPLETSDDDLVNLLSVVHSFMNSDEDQNNLT